MFGYYNYNYILNSYRSHLNICRTVFAALLLYKGIINFGVLENNIIIIYKYIIIIFRQNCGTHCCTTWPLFSSTKLSISYFLGVYCTVMVLVFIIIFHRKWCNSFTHSELNIVIKPKVKESRLPMNFVYMHTNLLKWFLNIFTIKGLGQVWSTNNLD